MNIKTVKLNYRIHSERDHQKIIAITLIRKYFMGIVGDHWGKAKEIPE